VSRRALRAVLASEVRTWDVMNLDIQDLRVVPELNSRSHWRVRAARFDAQRARVRTAWRMKFFDFRPPLPVTVTLTRIATRPIHDSDNLISGFKAIRDEVAELLGTDDRDLGGKDGGITWRYEQLRGPARYVGVRVRVEWL